MFKDVSEGELVYYREGLRNGVRFDGRALCDTRESIVIAEEKLFPNALYGVKVDIPDSKSSFLIAINGDIEISEGDEQTDRNRLIEVEIKTSTDSDSFRDKTAQADKLNEIKACVKEYLINFINVDQFYLKEKKVYWKLVCDVFVVGSINLSDFDFLIRGIRTCLLHVKFPKVNVSFNQWSEEYTYEMLNEEISFFSEDNLPFACLVGEINGKVVVDMTRQELYAVDSYYIAVISSEGNLLNVEKFDGKSVSLTKMATVYSKIADLSCELIR